MHGLIRDVEDGYVKRIAFVVPRGAAWPLPVYELALLTAERAFEMCVGVDLTLVTPEASPLELFGTGVSGEVARLLTGAGVDVRTRADAARCLTGGERVVTVPVLHGPAITGLPHSAYGFLPVDAHGRVIGVDDVYAAGDATDFTVKQGGIACQQADAAAQTIAARAGIDVGPAPFEPVLSATLLTQRERLRLECDAERAGQSRLARSRSKFAGRELSRLLEATSAG
jgi:sulfide:quinone oxidoreductase